MEEAKRLPKARARRGRLRPHPYALQRVSCTARRPLGWGGKGRAGRPSYLAIPARAPAQPQGRAVTRALLPRRVPTRRESMVRGAGERAPPRENLGERWGRPGAAPRFPCPLLRSDARPSPPTLSHTRTHTPTLSPPSPSCSPGFTAFLVELGRAGRRGASGIARAKPPPPLPERSARSACCAPPAAFATPAAAPRLLGESLRFAAEPSHAEEGWRVEV